MTLVIKKKEEDSTAQTIVLPPVDTVPLLMMRFSKISSQSKNLVSSVKERLRQRRIIVTSEDQDANGQTILGLTTSQEEIDKEAQRCDLLKPTTYNGNSIFLIELEGTPLMKPFIMSEKEKFLNLRPQEELKHSAFDKDNLFSSSDRVRLMYSILEAITVLEVGENESALSRLLHNHNEYLCDSLRMLEIIDTVSPVHISHIKDKVCQETLKYWTPTPVQGFRDYYGEEVALYFAWMDFYIKALLFP